MTFYRISGLLFIIFFLSCSTSGIDDLFSRKSVLPEVLSSSITDMEVGVGLNPEIDIKFSEPMDIVSVNESISLSRSNIWGVGNLSFEWSENNSRLKARFVGALAEYSFYTFAIGDKSKSKTGFALKQDYIVSFRTRSSDAEPPYVSGIEPADGSSNVPPNAKIVIAFSESIDFDTIVARQNFIVKSENDQTVDGVINRIGANLEFKPNLDLAPLEKYYVEIKKGYRDIVGNEATTDFISSFRVAGEYRSVKSIEVLSPKSIAVSAVNDIYVLSDFDKEIMIAGGGIATIKNSKIVKYDGESQKKLYELDLTYQAEFIAVDNSDDVYVAIPEKHCIKKYDANGYEYGWLGMGSVTSGWHRYDNTEDILFGTGEGQFMSPSVIDFDKDNNLFVSDYKKIMKFDRNGEFVKQLNYPNFTDDAFIYLRIDCDDNLIVKSEVGGRIVKYDNDLDLVSEWSPYIQFYGKIAITTDALNYVYISYNYLIRKYYSNGIFITEFGSSDPENVNFLNGLTYDIVVDKNENIYVCDYIVNQVKIFRRF